MFDLQSYSTERAYRIAWFAFNIAKKSQRMATTPINLYYDIIITEFVTLLKSCSICGCCSPKHQFIKLILISSAKKKINYGILHHDWMILALSLVNVTWFVVWFAYHVGFDRFVFFFIFFCCCWRLLSWAAAHFKCLVQANLPRLREKKTLHGKLISVIF